MRHIKAIILSNLIIKQYMETVERSKKLDTKLRP